MRYLFRIQCNSWPHSTPTSGTINSSSIAYCRALDLGVPRSVVERPASTQGAVQPEPVGRDRRDGAHANPTSNASRSDPNVYFYVALFW